MVEEKDGRQEEEIDQGDDYTTALSGQNNSNLIIILNSVNFNELLPLVETFIMSRVSHVHSLYIAQPGVGF